MSGDYQLEDTLHRAFTTRAFATGIPTTLAGTPSIDIYEDAVATPNIIGETLTVDLNSVSGFNMITVTATAGTGFEAGKSYTAVIAAGTVGGVSVVGEVVDHFTLDKSAAAKDLANGTDGLGALKTGIDDIPTVAEFNARTIASANYFDPTADTVSLVTTVTTLTNKTGFSLAATGLDTIPATASGMLAAADAVWDEVLTGGEHNVVNSAGRRLRQLQEAGGYSNGFIYVDTVNGVDASTSFEDGVETNPVDGMVNANILAAALNISRFFILPGSTITLAATQTNQTFAGENWALALGGQSIVGSTISGATVSGVSAGVGTTQIFRGCMMNATTHRKGTHLIDSVLIATQTIGEAGDFFVASGHAGTAGTGTPIVDYGAALNASDVHFSNWEGQVEFQNMGQGAGTYSLEVLGRGDVTLNANCVGGDIDLHGHLDLANNGSGMTIVQTSNYTAANVNAEVDTALRTTTDTEPSSVPAATSGIVARIGWLFSLARNKGTQTSTTKTLRNDVDGADIATSAISDDGTTFIRNKYS